jgi:protein-S-isoprenylcysteine O-methyltransferase Ste14
MIFRDEHTRSILPKAFIALAILASIYISGSLIFVDESELWPFLKPYKVHGDPMRNVIILSGLMVYFLRLLVTLFIFFQRKMFWGEAFVIANIMPWIFPYVAYTGGNSDDPIGFVEILGILLFITGSYLNSASEYLRYAWKKRTENFGKLYTQGLFKHARHINYSGDIVLFSGFAAMAHHVGLLIIPACMAAFFTVVLIPLKEHYLKEKYGPAFDVYANRTKKLIPFVY